MTWWGESHRNYSCAHPSRRGGIPGWPADAAQEMEKHEENLKGLLWKLNRVPKELSRAKLRPQLGQRACVYNGSK